jgi:TonB-linked SusC/RagA family outer membrane protein
MHLKALFIFPKKGLTKTLRVMKLTALLLLTICVQVSARTYSQRVTLSAKNMSLEKVIGDIKKQTGYSFFYNVDWLQKANTVTIEVKNMQIENALNIIFKDQPLSYSVINNTIVLKLKEVSAEKVSQVSPSPLPPPDIHGRVVNEKGEPMEGVTVSIKGTRQATATNANGEYTIAATKGQVLVFTYINYSSHEVSVGSQNTYNIALQLQGSTLNDVVVIGYGSRQKKDVTGAVSSVGSKEIEKSTAISPELALQGRAAGVLVGSGGGDPQARPTVLVRGLNTFGFSEPLYVIDGVPLYEGGGGVTTGGIGDIRSPINILSMINPQDIESISVLKDASAAAIYGVQAANGVILITTKKGKAGRPKVEVASYFGTQNIPKTLSVLNTQQYFTLLREAYANNPVSNGSGGFKTFEEQNGPRYDAASSQYVGNSATYDWQNALLNKNAALQEHSVRVSGGNEGTTYYFSAGYAKTESPLKANNLERYSFAMNIDSRISKYVQAGITLRLVQENALVNTQADLGTMLSTIPFQPIYDPSDPTGFAPVTSATFIPNPDYDPNLLNAGAPFIFDGDPQLLWGTQTRFNVFAFQQLNNNTYDLKRAIGNAYAQIEPITGLKLKGTLGGDYYFNLRRSWTNLDQWRFSQTPGNPYERQDGKAVGQYGERQGRTYNLNKDLTLNYNHTYFKDHNIDIIVGASEQFARWSWTDASGNVDYADPQYRSIGNIPPFTTASASILQEDALVSYFGRLSYKYKDKYYLDGTLRRDESSRLAPGHKAETFPSFAAAWRISAEDFFPKNTFINDLKLRGGWGRLGNFKSAGYYEFLSGISTSPDYPVGSGNGNPFGTQVQAVSLPNFANTTLTWEKLKTTTVGFDAQLFHNQVSFTAEYYHKITYDIIQSVPLPPNTGIEAPASQNVAQVKNTGVEIQLGYNGKLGPVNFNVSGNLTTINNKVLKLNLGNPFGDELGRVEEGYSIGYLWGYKVGGIFQSQAEIDEWSKSHTDKNISQPYQPGDMYFQDVYGNPRNSKERFSPMPDSVINDNDRTYLGKTIPGYFYGFNIGANYKGFDISIFFQGIGDVQKYNGLRAGLEGMSGLANQLTTVLDRWTPTHPSTTMPRAAFNDPSVSERFSSRFIENAGYLRLKNLQIGYSLPRGLLNKAGFIQNLRIYGSAVNLFTVTDWSGLDPENDLIPPTRQFLFGVNATF